MTMFRFFCVVWFVLTTSLFASQGVFDSYDIRQKAMGGVQVASIKRPALFYQNPAGLELLESFKLALLPRVGLGANEAIMDRLSEFEKLVEDGASDSDRIKTLKKLTPLRLGINAELHWPVFAKKSFGIMAQSQAQLSGSLKRRSSPVLRAEGFSDTSVLLGMSHTFILNNKPVHIGLSPKYVMRTVVYDQKTGKTKLVKSQADILKSINSGEGDMIDVYNLDGFSMDFGLLRPIKRGYWGLTVKNIGSGLTGIKRVGDSEKNITDALPVLGTVGVGLDSSLPYFGKLHMAADYAFSAPTPSFFKRLHLGVEKTMTPILTLRGGLNQGFIVGGFGINIFVVKVDYAFFAQELSDTIGQNSVNTHHIQLGVLF